MDQLESALDSHDGDWNQIPKNELIAPHNDSKTGDENPTPLTCDIEDLDDLQSPDISEAPIGSTPGDLSMDEHTAQAIVISIPKHKHQPVADYGTVHLSTSGSSRSSLYQNQQEAQAAIGVFPSR